MAAFVPALLLCYLLSLMHGYVGASAPAMYVFGDSLADVGNNNYLTGSLIKINVPHNGIDFPGQEATGRFSNGKNAIDFLAEKLGVVSPPYLSIINSSSTNQTEAFLAGVNFASGGAGILDSTNQGQCLSFNNQIGDFTSVHSSLARQLGGAVARDYISKCVFSFIIGNNELFMDPPQSVDFLISTLQGQLKKLYDLGARKVLFMGAGPLGCTPSQRIKTENHDCYTETNTHSMLFNDAVEPLLQQLQSSLSNLSYSFFDTYNAILKYIDNPAPYGFTEVKAGCCGLGELNGEVTCLPFSTYCPNRKNHIFWDPYHPTERTADLLTTIVVDGSPPLVFPINARQLSAI